ncbi:glycosyltransferase [Ornithinimicrobium sp. Y1847]|uniref:glycosyltransferase n=1 Tax=Ornithinimicrobium sp. Y1847 TaxID=3405419 RepID=UPI003B67CEF4
MSQDLRVVTLTTALPHAAIEHAGGKYLNLLLEELGPDKVIVIAPPLPSVVRAVGLPGHPPRTIITRPLPDWLQALESKVRRLDPGMPSWSLLHSLLRDRHIKAALMGADVIDLQWQDTIRLSRLVRCLAPAAWMVGTFHDVQTQKFRRLADRASGLRRLKWRVAERIARRSERVGARLLDTVVVFSDKDRDLLPSNAPATVVDPPLAQVGDRQCHAMPDTPTVVFVAFFIRPENHEAAMWLLREVWPLVHQRVPSAQLSLVGAGSTSELAAETERTAGACSLGYVDDLDDVLAAASVALVPLLDGAGVKFKTIEALLAGVPVVTTSIGAEGIQPVDLFWRVTDDTQEFANAICEALIHPAEAQAVADEAQIAATTRYSRSTFSKAVSSVYRVKASRARATIESAH